MKRSKKVLVTLAMVVAILLSSSATQAGIIVGLRSETKSTTVCEQKTSDFKTVSKFDSGIIVGFTGIIVGFTGIIVGLFDSQATCGHIPTSD